MKNILWPLLLLALAGKLTAGDVPTISSDAATAELEFLQQIVDAYEKPASGPGSAPRFKNISAADAQVLLPKFKEALATMDFSDAGSRGYTRQNKPPTRLHLCIHIAQRIVAGNRDEPATSLEDETGPLHLVEALLLRISAQIDPQWTRLPVYMNVSPPPGTPHAASGMSPEAIEDPKLRQGYLDNIAKNQANNLKNGQQRLLREARARILRSVADLVVSKERKGFTKEDLLQHFAKDEASKGILEGRWRSAGK